MTKTDAKEYAREMGRAAYFEGVQEAKHEAAIEGLTRRVGRMDPTDEKYAEYCKRIDAHTRAAVACRKRAEDYTARGIAARQAAK